MKPGNSSLIRRTVGQNGAYSTSLRRLDPPVRSMPCAPCSISSLTVRHSASGVRAGIMGSRTLALQWSHCSLQSPPVIDTAGHALLPQSRISSVAKALNVGV